MPDKTATHGSSDGDVVWMPQAEFFEPDLQSALFEALEPGQTFGFNYSDDGESIWVQAQPSQKGGPPQDTLAWVARARSALGR